MQQEVNLGGAIYISSKRAAEITGYTQDYIGQLARGGHIRAQRISGLWYVVEESLRDYKAKADAFKPTPPPYEPPIDMDASVSFDGRDYISAQRAAIITGYHQDYVGQLARSGKIASRQVGTRWYVDREGLVAHKKHNDALLAAVQAQSVGLARERPVHEESSDRVEPHFKYISESDPVLPALEKRSSESPDPETVTEEHSGDEVNEIPIRIIRQPILRESAELSTKQAFFWPMRRIVGYIALLLIVALGAGSGYFYFSKDSESFVVTKTSIELASTVLEAAKAIEVPEFLTALVSNELYYRRDSF